MKPDFFSLLRFLIIDMDGVLWRGNTPMPHLVEFFNTLRRRKIAFVLATNNASKSTAEYVQRLADFGVKVKPDEIMTSPAATALYLAASAPNARVFCLGEPGLAAELRGKNVHVLEGYDESATHVVVGIDRYLTYQKLCDAALLIRKGAAFIGTNPDVTFPSERGIVPGNGATLAALQAATGVKPIIIGKPEVEMMTLSMARMKATPANTAVLGDRLDTDILAGINAKLHTILVMSGVTDEAELAASPIQPDYVFADIGELTDRLLV